MSAAPCTTIERPPAGHSAIERPPVENASIERAVAGQKLIETSGATAFWRVSDGLCKGLWFSLKE